MTAGSVVLWWRRGVPEPAFGGRCLLGSAYRLLMDPPKLRRLVLKSIVTESEDTYVLEFEDRDGGPVDQVMCRLERVAGDPVVGIYEPDPFVFWMGDAESVRSVTAAVLAVDRARQLSLRDCQ